jgi:hypothetical protein
MELKMLTKKLLKISINMNYTSQTYKPLKQIVSLIYEHIKEKRKVDISDLYLLHLHLDRPNEYSFSGLISIKLSTVNLQENGTVVKHSERLSFDKNKFDFISHSSEDYFGEGYINNESRLSEEPSNSTADEISNGLKAIIELLEDKECEINISSEKLVVKPIKLKLK